MVEIENGGVISCTASVVTTSCYSAVSYTSRNFISLNKKKEKSTCIRSLSREVGKHARVLEGNFQPIVF